MKLPVSSRELRNLSILYTETGGEMVVSRREKHKLILHYKMQNGMTLEYLSSLAPPTIGSTIR